MKIVEDEANTILAELVERKITNKRITKNGDCQFVIQFNELSGIQFPTCPVYENVVLKISWTRRTMTVLFTSTYYLNHIQALSDTQQTR